ncbi:unnamed protein product [Paramecium primaurelia]|uniref:Uncharacterized protein n=2 Tax=Paramecium TaxID=5884 RepID=A0A8S1VB08_9CILI|nr:unnamed protein product [Paramecium primaurelia]CAD8173761.1 unnamed protein product [Paramecium pentaurelia]
MLCCSNAKKIKSSQQQNAINLQVHLNQQEESLNINDEACTYHTTIQVQQFKTIQIYKMTLDHQTISRSNSSGNNDHVAQFVFVKPIRKTPFITFRKRGTDSSTKYLSTKQGYTLLVTHLSN